MMHTLMYVHAPICCKKYCELVYSTIHGGRSQCIVEALQKHLALLQKVQDTLLVTVLGAQLTMCYQSPLHGSSVVVLLVSCLCSLYPVADSIKFEDFIGYPFGAEYGYSLFPRGVDLYEGGPTTIPFPYFGQKYNFVNVRLRMITINLRTYVHAYIYMYVHTYIRTLDVPVIGNPLHVLIPFSVQIDDSGYVALINGQSTVSTPFSAGTIRFPFKLTAANIDWSAVIAPFWADISTDGYQSGRIYFKNFTKGEEMQATADVRKLIASTIPQLRGFTPEWTLIVTWDQVGYFNDNDDKVCIAWQITLYHDHGGLSHFSIALC